MKRCYFIALWIAKPQAIRWKIRRVGNESYRYTNNFKSETFRYRIKWLNIEE